MLIFHFLSFHMLQIYSNTKQSIFTQRIQLSVYFSARLRTHICPAFLFVIFVMLIYFISAEERMLIYFISSAERINYCIPLLRFFLHLPNRGERSIYNHSTDCWSGNALYSKGIHSLEMEKHILIISKCCILCSVRYYTAIADQNNNLWI